MRFDPLWSSSVGYLLIPGPEACKILLLASSDTKD